MKKITLCFVVLVSLQSYSQCWNKIVLGGEQSFASKSDNTFWVWGRNDFGELGIGSIGLKNSPTPQPINENWVQYEIGFSYGLALKNDGTLWAWGNNQRGQLGIGPSSIQLSPIQVGSETDWVSISAKSYSSFGIKSNGTLWAWGRNNDFQLGCSYLDEEYLPVQVGTSTDWAKVRAGYDHTMAIKTDGTLWGWGGLNSNILYGEVGTGTTTITSTPTQISGESNWEDVALGRYFTLAVKTDGTLWAWGRNNYGQLGDGTTVNKFVPTQIGTDSDWDAIAADLEFCLAIKNNGTLWSWGSNTVGQLGNGTATLGAGTVPNPIITQVGTDTNWLAISAGQQHVGGLKNDGTLWMWGLNESAELGFGFTPATIQDGGYFTIPTELSCQPLALPLFEGTANFYVYPNPTNDILNIKVDESFSIEKLTITDLTGKLLYQTNSDRQFINLEHLEKGMYFIEIFSGSQSSIRKFLIK